MIRVLIAEDALAVRETVAALLGLEDDIEVAAAVESGDQVVPAALAHRPDVALLDVGLPGTDGITAASELAARLPFCKVLILTGLEDLIAAIRTMARGDQVIDSRMTLPIPNSDQGPPAR